MQKGDKDSDTQSIASLTAMRASTPKYTSVLFVYAIMFTPENFIKNSVGFVCV